MAGKTASTGVIITAEDRSKTAFDSFIRNIGGAQQNVRLLTTDLTGMAGAMAAGNLAAMAATKVMGAVGDAIGMLKDSAVMAARYETLGVVLQSVGRNAGYSGGEILKYADDVRKMGITMIESRQVVAQLAQAQIDLSESTTLARIAQDAAVIGNINSSEALGRLVHGLQTAQTDVLRTIGINVNFEDSYKRLAEQLGKNTTDLTLAEKATARLNAVKEAGARIAGTYQEAMGTAGKQMSSLARYSEDAQTKLGSVFNDTLLLAVSSYTDLLKDANGELDDMANSKKLDEWGNDVADTFAFVADAAKYSFGVLYTTADTAYTALMQLSRFTVGDYKGIATAGDRYVERQSAYWDPSNSAQVKLEGLRSKRAIDSRTVYGEGGKIKFQFSTAKEKQQYLDDEGFINSSSGGGPSPGKPGKDKRDEFADLMAETSGLNKDFHRDLETLNAGYRQGRVGLDEYRGAVERLVEKQPFAIATAKQEQDAREAQTKVYERVADAESEIAKAMETFAAANQNQAAVIQAQIDAIGATPEEIERIRQLAQVDRDLAKAIAEVKAATAKTGDIEGEASRIHELTRRSDQAKKAISGKLDEKDQAILDYNADWTNGAKKAMEDYQRTAENVAGQTQEAFASAFSGMEDALVSYVQTGKLDFKSLADSIVADIIRIQVRAAMSSATSSLVGLLFGSGSSGASGYMGTSGSSAVGSGTALTSMNFGVAHSGGIVGALSGSKAASPAVFAGASRYHGGGLVDGEVPIIAKKGEGVFTPEQMKALGGGTNITIINNSGQPVSQREVPDGRGGRKLEVQIGEAMAAQMLLPGSSANKARRANTMVRRG